MKRLSSQPKGAPKRERMCIACGTKGGKDGLLRIVRDADGSVRLDPTGKAAGRGAYVCSAECFCSLRPGRLERALKTKVTDEAYNAIAVQMGASAAVE